MRYDIIAFILITIIAAFGVFRSVWTYNKYKRLVQVLIDVQLEKSVLEDMITKQATEASRPVDQNDGFIKFLSDSREWAFNYIEKVQEELSTFKAVVYPELNKLKTKDSVDKKQLDTSLAKVSSAFENLMKNLPTDASQVND